LNLRKGSKKKNPVIKIEFFGGMKRGLELTVRRSFMLLNDQFNFKEREREESKTATMNE